MDQQVSLRLMLEQDVADVIRIQTEAYEEALRETEAVIRARLMATPETAWVVESEKGVCAYLVAYKSLPGFVSPWGQAFTHKAEARTLYIHDIALGLAARGKRIAQWLIEEVLQQARLSELDSAALVSVQNSQLFWQKMGFEIFPGLSPDQRENLNTYAGGACYMLRTLK